MKLFLLILLVHLSLSANWKTEREQLHNVYILDEFRIFYDTKGKHQIYKLQDNNANQIPDYIENIALRFKYSRLILTEVLGFHNPLQSKRYKDVNYIDIHILNDKSNTTGDGIHHFNYKFLNNKNYKSIAIKLKSNLRDATMTPSHEYFHVMQNSYAMFKNRWFTEGTARWAEGIFEKGTGRRGELPKNINDLEKLLEKTYDAKYFWRKLNYLCDTDNGHFKQYDWMNKTVKGYSPLIEDNRVYGYSFFKVFLQNLDKEDNVASKQRGIHEFTWREKDQRENQDNNKYILKALKSSISSECKIQSSELQHFTHTVDFYIKNSLKGHK